MNVKLKLKSNVNKKLTSCGPPEQSGPTAIYYDDRFIFATVIY